MLHLNVTQAAVHKERWREQATAKKKKNTVLLRIMDQIVYTSRLGPMLRITNSNFFKSAVSVKNDNFEGYFSQQKLMF